jgi:hypothetical protein
MSLPVLSRLKRETMAGVDVERVRLVVPNGPGVMVPRAQVLVFAI